MRTSQWKLLEPKNVANLLSSDPIGDSSVGDKPIGLSLEPNLSFAAGKLALNIRGQLSVAVLKSPDDDDEDALLGSGGAEVVEGDLPPQLAFDAGRAWLKFRAEAGVKATGTLGVTDIIGLDIGAEQNVIVADYRVHKRDQPTRAAFEADIKNPARFATNLAHVEQMAPGEALALRLRGAWHAAVTVSWADVFTGQIGSLSARLGMTTPIAISLNAGASVTADVRVSDDFVIVFSRISPQRWRAGLRKVKSSRLAPSVDAGIEVGFTDPNQIESVLGAFLEGVVGSPWADVKGLLKTDSLESLGGAERKTAFAVMERLGLKPAVDTLSALRQRVADVQKGMQGVIEDVARTRIALSFAYEYNRVSEHLSLLQVSLSQAALKQFHGDLIRARTLPVTTSIAANVAGVTLELYLNQKSLSRERSWGFTLGLGKWVHAGGRDFKKVAVVQRFDLENRVQESYLGARGYKGSWAGESIEWGVDFKADMKDYAREPKVSDYSFGLHLLLATEQRSLEADELEEWLDAAVIWRVVREADVPDMRGLLANALTKAASVSVQVTIPDAVLRSMFPALASAESVAYAPSLAAAMPWIKDSPARSSASRRRQIYSPLWMSHLRKPDQSVATLAARAAARLKAEGHEELVLRETAVLSNPDPFSFAGLTRINGDTRRVCDAFTRGVGILTTAIETGARNRKTIDKAVQEMNDLWTQSHHVRAMGVYLVDAAERVGQLREVTRTLTVQPGPGSETIVVTA
jgi:hypothetical protein